MLDMTRSTNAAPAALSPVPPRTCIARLPTKLTAFLCPFNCPGPENPFPRHGTIIKRNRFGSDRLEGLVTLAGDDHHVSGTCHVNRPSDGLTPVGSQFVCSRSFMQPGAYLLDDCQRILSAGIVGSDDHMIAHANRYPSHHRPLG